jgi:glycosyltransferase involved in cell wall biosynthesis
VRVGFVTGEYPPTQGGVGAFTCEIARAMTALGHQVFVFTRHEAHPVSGSFPPFVTATVGQRWGWGTIPQIREWTRENRLDIINIQFQTAAYAMHPSIHWLPARITGIPVVVTFHDLRVPYLFPKAGPLRQWVVKKLAHDADGVIATDRADESTLRDEWHIPCVRWIPIGSNVRAELPSMYDRTAQRAVLNVHPDDLLISYFGFLNESKGGLILIEALSHLVEQGIPAHLVMIGGRAGASDPTNLEYGKRIDTAIEQHQLNDRVHWTGFVDDMQVSAYFYASDLTALPYLDGVSLRRGTLMAALAHGRAIVTTHPQTCAPELDGVVETVTAGDPKALAEAIKQLWYDHDRRKQLEQAAAEAAQLFSWENIARQTLDFYYDLLRRGNGLQ